MKRNQKAGATVNDQNDKQEQETTEQSAALDALDAIGADEQEVEKRDEGLALSVTTDADKAEQEKQAKANQEQAAKMGAAMAVGFAENMLQMRLPYVTVDDQARAGLVDSLAPVMAKHGGGMPDWLLPYAEEVRFGMTLAGFGFGVWMQVQAHRDELAAANDDNPANNQGSGGAVPKRSVPKVQAQGAGADLLDPTAQD
ncbi:hypothetical protein [Alcanivorax sp.]|uniref:hypothetical protein n=1 Tax=Alcanivorax sp. TaxID=1872427 RepID=UPI0025BB2FF1|nr:hypothetical protein [Alcanivorax sp.]